MAEVKLNPLFEEVHGRIGDLIFRRGPHGQTIISKMPRQSLLKVIKVRKIQKKRMLEAHAQARAAMADPLTRAYYELEAKKKGKRAYSLALTDSLHRQS